MTAPVESFAARRARYETRGAANDNFRLRLVISNKFTGQTGGSLPFTPTYDATGNMTGINNGITLVYDGRNRVASSTGAGIVTNYWVNGLGQRVRKTWNGTPASHVLFTYDPAGKHIGTYDLNGTLTEETIFLGDTPIAVVTGAGTFNLYADHINAIRQVTNQSNQTRWSWEQTNAFGSTLPNQNPSNLGTFNYRRGFPGQFYDAELLTWNNGFRTYHAGLGRYLQPDPIGLAGGDASLYGYVRQNPAFYSDAFGLSPDLICVASCMYIGSEIGGGAGFVLGGGGGTLVAPGVGTIGGAAGGQAVGIVGGSLIGGAVGMAVCPNADARCTEIQNDIYEAMNEIRKRIRDLLEDRCGLHGGAFDKPNPGLGPGCVGTWVGHQEQVRGWQARLRNLIAKANRMGCAIPKDAWELASRPIPQFPSGWVKP